MGALHLPQGDTLQLIGTAKGIEIRGPGGQLLLTNRMVAELAEFSVSLLDILQDPDLEPNGDELDGNGSEEDFMYHDLNSFGEPGCPISDPDFGAEEAGEREEGTHEPLYGVDQTRRPREGGRL